MDGLTINDLSSILSLAIQAECAQNSVNHLKKFIATVDPKSRVSRKLSENEIRILSADKMVAFIMILFFLTKNVSLEFLRREVKSYKNGFVCVKDLWDEIEGLIKRKMLLSREISSYFCENEAGFTKLIDAAKSIIIEDLSFQEFVNNEDCSTYRLDITGKYHLFSNALTDKSIRSTQELYTLHDRKTCFHIGLYDPFKFEESQTSISFRYLNTSPTRTLIDSVFTLKFSFPELTVLNNDGTFIKIKAENISDFLEKHLLTQEISLDLYQAVRKDYPKLFLPPLDLKTLRNIYNHLKQLIRVHLEEATNANKPLMILMSEVHGSKESFLFNTLIVSIASTLGIRHLLVETINVYHEQYGWDAQVTEIKRLISFAQKTLGVKVKDLEEALHYKGRLCPYPYHEIPEHYFGINAREASWIIDAEKIKENKVMIVGSGHLNNLLNSALKESNHILPIDCTGDIEFSKLLSISQHHFVSLDKKVNHLSHNEIIEMVKNCTSST